MKIQPVTNHSNIPLEMAVWLLLDEYDYIKEENYISATGLLKPVRHIVLPPRIPPEEKIIPDVADLIPSAMGSSLHASIEKAWQHEIHVRHAMRRLGHPEDVIARVVVNPTPEKLESMVNPIPVYIEQRSFKQITVEGVTFTIGGKFDMVLDGYLADTKSSSVWAWIKGDRDEMHRLQLSIYRWLNPELVTEYMARINYIFTDWNKADARNRADYPACRIMSKELALMSLDETETWIRDKLSQILKAQELPENEIPECTPEELWMTQPVFKYYADPAKANTPGARSTKNFDSLSEANAFMASKGKGTVVAFPGVPKRCGYCAAFPICTQKDKYVHE